jgi:hypothetical protein
MIPLIAFALAAACLLCAAYAQEADDQVQVRLLNPIGSQSKARTQFTARVLGPVQPGEPDLPRGITIHGHVLKAHAVGLGLRRERASLTIGFDRCVSPAGEDVECELELVSVDNSRETVRQGNVVVGVLAAANAHSWFNGLWLRPTSGFLRRAAMGLTGITGLVQSRLVPHPAGATFALVSKFALLRMPDPEIRLNAGTELNLRVRKAAPDLMAAGLQEKAIADQGLAAQLGAVPPVVRRPSGTATQDVIHLVFVGEADRVANAFRAAGWKQADPAGVRTAARVYRAYAGMRGYGNAPVSPLLFEGREPEFVFQKVFNSVAKRHHIRIWPHTDLPGLFVAAATHDIALGREGKSLIPTHIIDSDVDKERTKVINDLMDAGCVREVWDIERPELASAVAEKGGIRTDGRLVVVELEDCTEPPAYSGEETPGVGMARGAVRRVILETRHYFTRGNLLYWGSRGLWSGVKVASNCFRMPTAETQRAQSQAESQLLPEE